MRVGGNVYFATKTKTARVTLLSARDYIYHNAYLPGR